MTSIIDTNAQFVTTVLHLVEILGTFTFAVSGIRQAAAKQFDWFGGFACGFTVAIGGGTLRDVMLGVTPFWMTDSLYLLCTLIAQIAVIVFAKHLKKLNNTWFVFDTLGLALFTIAGIQKTLALGEPYWVAIIMGCITGVAGGIIRDLLLGNTPLIFKKEIYAMATVAAGCLYSLLFHLHVDPGINALLCSVLICLIRFLSMRYHLSLPALKNEG